ncbi:MAG: HAMP domain-containing histidine kinase [Actinomycetia bacterium]|nr:HAMP domain-containing histidine kinase [Actinomycetes bacterium]
MNSPRQRFGLGARLLVAQALVLVAGGATTGVVAAVVGPPLFREHLLQAGVTHDSGERFHAEQAYRYATTISISVAVGVAALTALMVTAYLSRRLQRSVAEVSAAATAVADGRYGIRVSPLHLGEDFGNLSRAFNEMAQRLESVEATRRQLFGDLAHEIRTPVSVLEAYMEAVEDGVKTLDSETIAMLRDQTLRLVRFAEDVAALAEAEEARATVIRQRIDPAAVIAQTAQAAADRYAAKQVSLSTTAGPLPPVWADPHRLAQVLANLLDNALRHTPPGGNVEICASADHDGLTIAVTDDGEGIDTAHLPHVFERFYRADTARNRNRGGAGIGLAIVKALAEAHGGHVTADSCGLGTGSVFTVTVPMRPAADDGTARHGGQSKPARTSQLRDDPPRTFGGYWSRWC